MIMNEEMQMLRLATIIDESGRACADGYTRYAGTIGTAYVAPIGDLTTTKSDTDAALEAAYITDSAGANTDTGNNTKATQEQVRARMEQPAYEGIDNLEELPKTEQDAERKKSILDRIKEKPVLFGLIAVFLTIITLGIYKSKKG